MTENNSDDEIEKLRRKEDKRRWNKVRKQRIAENIERAARKAEQDKLSKKT